jgi:hypothetical protein
MVDIIGEATGQERFRSGTYSSTTGEGVLIRGTEHIRETRTVEMLQEGESAKSEGGTDEHTRNRTKLEDGNIIIETYTEDGKLVKITPPGYLPIGKIA